MTISVKTNLHLWLLTGRSDGFANPALNCGVMYPTMDAPEDVLRARHALKLDDTRTDFHVIGAMAAAFASQPVLRALPEDRSLMFAEDLVHLPGSSVSGATMIAQDGSGWPVIDGSVAGRYGFTQLTIRRQGDYAIIDRDDGKSFREFFRQTSGRLVIENLQTHGIRAHFVVDSWTEGREFKIIIAPTKYPYQAFADKIRTTDGLPNLMLEEGTIDAFVSSLHPIRKVGALATAVMRKMARLTSESGGVVVAPEIPAADGAADFQLMIDWRAITMDGSPVTATIL